MSQGELAFRIGKDQPYISDIERGKSRRPGDWMVRKIASALEMDAHELFEALGAEVVIGEGIAIPVVGFIPADGPRYTNAEGLPLPDVRVLPEDVHSARSLKDLFGLRVTGDCMASIGILDGDIIIAEPAYRHPRGGELVIVRIGDEFSLKRWSMFLDTVELRDGTGSIVWSGAATDVEVVAFYVTFKPVAPR